MILLKRVSTSSGIITIIAAILILFGGVFAYQYFFVKPVATSSSAQQILNKPFPLAGEPTDQTAGCLNSGGTVNTIDCYCSESTDFQDNCAIGGCACPPNPAYKKTAKSCDCGQGKCFDGEKCVAFPF
jgi:hypothetical protein